MITRKINSQFYLFLMFLFIGSTFANSTVNNPTPNPHRVIISEELLQWHNWLKDGSFEQGTTEIHVSSYQGLNQAQFQRSEEAARSGDYGYTIAANSDEGLTFSVISYLDKGEDVRFSFWARSPEGQVVLSPVVAWVERNKEDNPRLYNPEKAFIVTENWTQISFETENTKILRRAMLTIEIGPGMTLYLDDFKVEQPIWKIAEYQGDSHVIGGINVPPEPVAPTHLSFLIHIEDPDRIQKSESYFWDRTSVFIELASLLHSHGGFLTIQPEEDWVMAADRFAPGLLKQLADDFNVQYSTHTHGPHCRDDQERLRSLTDCSAHFDDPNWDQSVSSYDYPEVIEYVGNLQQLISTASGRLTTDHNGNWEFLFASRYADIGMLTLSAYKNHYTQRTYDVLINNPWRPTQCSADAEIDKFLTHDPNTEIVYIPGWGQTLTRYHERALKKLAPVVSQFIYYADPNRVNTLTIVLHVDTFQARYEQNDSGYIVYDPNTGEITYSEEFQTHLNHWDRTLTKLVDPLVDKGYLQWTSVPEMGRLYRQWEQDNSSGEVIPAEPSYEPPINVFFVLHIDPGTMNEQITTFQADPEIYQRTNNQIDWLISEAQQHNLNFTSLYNGWYPKMAMELGDLSQFEELLAAGHDIGTHAHRLTYDPNEDLWTSRVHELSGYGRPNYDPNLARQAWDDADRYVDQLLAQINAVDENQTMCSLAFTCSDEGNLMREFGFRVASGSRAEKALSLFGHLVWNPWRPAANETPGHELEEDLSTDYIALDHLAQAGIIGGAHGTDLSVGQLKRRFLMLYLEWLARERTRAEDRIWTFGFVDHPEDGGKFNDELIEFLTWLDENFIGKTSKNGNIIAQYATTRDIAQQFESWEIEHPETSSFSYIAGDPYPYTYAIVPTMLENAAYEARVDLGANIVCFKFSQNEHKIYLLWSEQGEYAIDFSGELSGQVSVTNMAGQQNTQDASAINLTEEPIFVE